MPLDARLGVWDLQVVGFVAYDSTEASADRFGVCRPFDHLPRTPEASKRAGRQTGHPILVDALLSLLRVGFHHLRASCEGGQPASARWSGRGSPSRSCITRVIRPPLRRRKRPSGEEPGRQSRTAQAARRAHPGQSVAGAPSRRPSVLLCWGPPASSCSRRPRPAGALGGPREAPHALSAVRLAQVGQFLWDCAPRSQP